MKKLLYIVLGFSLLISCTKVTTLKTLETPIALAPNVLSSNSFEPNWQPVANAQKYNVEIALNNTFSPIEHSVTFGPSNPIENLESNTHNPISHSQKESIEIVLLCNDWNNSLLT